MSDAALIQVPFWNGIDEAFDDLHTPISRMRSAQNLIFPTQGSVAKRGGFAPLAMGTGSGGTLGSVKRIANAGGELVAFNGISAYGYSPTTQKWMDHGRVSPCIATRAEFSTGYTAAIQPDAVSGAYINRILSSDVADQIGYRAIVWTLNGTAAQGGGHYATVLDIATGNPVTTAFLLQSDIPASQSPNCLIRVVGVTQNGVGSVFWVVYQRANSICMRQYNIATRTWAAEVSILAATGGTWTFDVAPNVGGSGDWILVWNDQTANSVRVQRMTLAGSVAAGPVNVATGLGSTMSVSVRSIAAERTWVIYANTGGLNCQVRVATHDASTMANLTGPFVMLNDSVPTSDPIIGIERLDSTHAIVTCGTTGQGLMWATCSNTTNIAGYGYNIGDSAKWIPISKPFMGPTGLAYVFAMYETQFGATQALLELSQNANVPAPAMAVVAPRTSSSLSDFAHGGRHSRSANIATPGDTTQTKYVTLGFGVNSNGSVGINVVTFDFAHPGLFQTVTLGQTSYVAGGVLTTYDGNRCNEAGFVGFPVAVPNVTGSSNVGGGMGKNVYHYTVVYRYRNARGEVTRSMPTLWSVGSIDFTASATTTNQATLSVPCITYAQAKQDAISVGNPIMIEVYRTAYVSGVEGNYYLVQTIPNQVGVQTVSITDLLDDATLQQNPLLYTVGNVLECDSPPSIRFLCVHNQRLFGLGDEGKVIWYTTTYTPGEMPRWNDALKLTIPGGEGDIVSLASLDGRLHAFTKTALFTFTGDGPNDTGAGESWSAAVKAPFNLGCVDPRAICVTPMGIVFQSERGVYLYDRSGDMKWIGQRFQRTLASFPVISAITHYESDGYLLFWLRASDTPGDAGRTVMWDYRHDCWSVWTVNTPVSSSAGVAAECVGGQMYAAFMNSDGVTSAISQYTPGIYQDSSPVYISVTTGWLTPADLQGFARVQRILLLEQRMSQHSLLVVIQDDYYAATDKSVVFSDAQLSAAVPGQVRITPLRQKVESMSLGINEISGGGTYQGPILEGLLFKVRAKRGEFRRIAAAQGA